MTDYTDWHLHSRHATLETAYKAGNDEGRKVGKEEFRAQVIDMLKQDMLLDRDSSLIKLVEAVRDL